jgi:hypothetical protein
MTAFATTGGTSHSTPLTGLTNGTSYTYFVKCKDAAGNTSGDASTSFSITAGIITMGENTVLPGDDSGNGNLLIAQDSTLSQAATIQSLSFYVNHATGKLRLGIYDASGPGGGPGALKAQTNAFTPVVGWNTQNVITRVSLPAGKYWLAYFASSDSLHFATNFSKGSYRTARLSFGSMPTKFPAIVMQGTTHWSLYGTLK